MTMTTRLFPLVLAAALLGGCATLTPPSTVEQPRSGSVLRGLAIDPATEERLLALDAAHVTDADVRGPLSKVPAPHMMLLHGGVYPVHVLMENFARFLTAMGYPEASIRDPDGALTRSPYEDSTRQAGIIAWHYEHEGLRPMIVGHSQGGIQAVKILHELNGDLGANLRVFDPVKDSFEDRSTIIDPLTGRERPITGLSVAYVGVVGTGGWSLALPIHWNIVAKIRSIPDTVDEFTGYRIGLDLFAWDAPGLEGVKTFHANGKANVSNVTLPAEYSHVFVPLTSQLTGDPAMVAWLNAFDPRDRRTETLPAGNNAQNALFAADVWYSIKKHWVLEVQRLLRARRAAG